MIQEYGFFTLYKPTYEQVPKDHPWRTNGTLFAQNGQGVDWYSIAHTEPKNTPGIKYVMLHKNNEVASVGDDAEMMWPLECYFLKTDLDVSIGDFFDPDTKTFRTPLSIKTPINIANTGPTEI